MLKTIKAFIILIGFLWLAIGAQPVVHAMTYTPNDPLVVDLNPISFWLFDIDGNADHEVNLTATTFMAPGGQLQYRYGSLDWSAFPISSSNVAFNSDFVTIDTGDDNMEQIFFRLALPGSPDITDGSVIFQSYDSIHSPVNGFDLYTTLTVLWDSTMSNDPLTVVSTDGNGRFATPIPASALLLLTGLIGLIGFRRRMTG